MTEAMTREELLKTLSNTRGTKWIEKALAEARFVLVEANRHADVEDVREMRDEDYRQGGEDERRRCAEIVRGMIDCPEKRVEYRAIARAIEQEPS